MTVQRIGPNLWRSQPTNPLTGKRLNLYGATRDECIARRQKVKQTIADYQANLIRADELSGVLVGLEVRRAVKVGELWAAWCDDLDHRARRGVVTASWARQCRACGALHLGSLGDRHPSELSAPVVEKWLQGLYRWHRGAGHEQATKTEELLSEAHQRAVWAKLAACIRWGAEQKLVGAMPWSRAPQFAERRPRTRDAARSGTELARLLAVASERDRLTGGDLMLRVGIMSQLGLRAGEAVALAWDQIRELPNGRVEVAVRFQRLAHLRRGERDAGRPVAPPKCGSERAPTYAATHPVVSMLRAQRARLERLGHYRSTGPVFPTPKGGWRGRDVVKPEVWRSLARAAGLERPGVRWVQHSARHSAGTLAAAGGATRPEVRDMLGHSDVGVTEAYFARALGGVSGDAVGHELMRAVPRELFALPAAPLERLAPVEVREASEVRGEDEAAREYKSKQLGHKMYNAAAAFGEWLDMGAPIEKPKARGEREAPPIVRRAARLAGERAHYRVERLLPAGWEDNPVIVEASREQLAKARDAGSKATLNKWKGLRRKLAREAAARGEELPLHVRDWLAATVPSPSQRPQRELQTGL